MRCFAAAVSNMKSNYRLKLATLYCAFAAVATVINLLSQEVSLYLYRGAYALLLAVIVGTATGLVSKYCLDKLYIFNHVSKTPKDMLSNFSSYTFTGLFTTLLFWAFEFGFVAIFGTELARVTGAVIGLAAGYGIKYQLDKRYVFQARET